MVTITVTGMPSGIDAPPATVTSTGIVAEPSSAVSAVADRGDRAVEPLAGRQLDLHGRAVRHEVGVLDVDVEVDGLGGGRELDLGLGDVLAEHAADAADACLGVDPHDLAELDGAVVVLAVVLLERLDGVGRRRRPVLVDRDVVRLGVAERGEHVLELQHVLAVGDGRAEVTPHRDRPVQGDDRLAVDLDDDAGVLDHRPDLGQTGQRALPREHERAGVAVSGRAVELLLLAEVALLDGDERLLGRRLVGRGLRLVAGVGDEHARRPGGGGHDDRAPGEGPPAHQPPSPSSPPDWNEGPSPDSPDGRDGDHRSAFAAAALLGRGVELVAVELGAVGAGRRALLGDTAVVAEHRVGHVDPVLAHALGELEHLGLHLGLLLGVDLEVAAGVLHERLAGLLGLLELLVVHLALDGDGDAAASPLICGSGMSMPWSRMHSVNASIASSMSCGLVVPSVVVSGPSRRPVVEAGDVVVAGVVVATRPARGGAEERGDGERGDGQPSGGCSRCCHGDARSSAGAEQPMRGAERALRGDADHRRRTVRLPGCVCW